MIYKDVTICDFIDSAILSDFTMDALEEMYNFYNDEDLFPDGVEWDPVAFNCEWYEESPEEVKETYSNIESIANAEDEDELIEALEYYTVVRKLKNGNLLYTPF